METNVERNLFWNGMVLKLLWTRNSVQQIDLKACSSSVHFSLHNNCLACLDWCDQTRGIWHRNYFLERRFSIWLLKLFHFGIFNLCLLLQTLNKLIISLSRLFLRVHSVYLRTQKAWKGTPNLSTLAMYFLFKNKYYGIFLALPDAFLMYFMFLTTQNENKSYLLKLLILKDPTVSFIFLINACLFSYYDVPLLILTSDTSECTKIPY